jgi:hypothetical protein
MKWRMKEQQRIEDLIAAQTTYGGLIYDRCGLRGEYRVTAEAHGGRVVLGYHPDRRTCYREAIAYLEDVRDEQ